MPEQSPVLDTRTPVVNVRSGNATQYLSDFIAELQGRVEAGPSVDPGDSVTLSAQAALIATTPLVVSTSLPLYRISYALRISQAAGATSAAQATFGWTEGGLPQTRVGANVNGNTTASKDSDVFLLQPDPGTVVTFAVSYASTGAPAMQYSLSIVTEGLG